MDSKDLQYLKTENQDADTVARAAKQTLSEPNQSIHAEAKSEVKADEIKDRLTLNHVDFIENENEETFAKRKREHILMALDSRAQSEGSLFDSIKLQHKALPNFDFSEIDISLAPLKAQDVIAEFGNDTPFLISSMTAGHNSAFEINLKLARAAAQKGWLMGVGSQRRELTDSHLSAEWRSLRAQVERETGREPKLLANLGIAQLIKAGSDLVIRLIEDLRAVGLIIHLNSLQEVLQPEGTPHFRGSIKAIQDLVKKSSVPIVVKETGCGIDAATARRLKEAGVQVVDVAGRGGTHWGRVEGLRAETFGVKSRIDAAETFKNWGLPTAQSLVEAKRAVAATTSERSFELWASGGIRTGLEAAIALRLGATRVGIAAPLLRAALVGEQELLAVMNQFEYEMKIAMFCTSSSNLSELKRAEIVKKTDFGDITSPEGRA